MLGPVSGQGRRRGRRRRRRKACGGCDAAAAACPVAVRGGWLRKAMPLALLAVLGLLCGVLVATPVVARGQTANATTAAVGSSSTTGSAAGGGTGPAGSSTTGVAGGSSSTQSAATTATTGSDGTIEDGVLICTERGVLGGSDLVVERPARQLLVPLEIGEPVRITGVAPYATVVGSGPGDLTVYFLDRYPPSAEAMSDDTLWHAFGMARSDAVNNSAVRSVPVMATNPFEVHNVPTRISMLIVGSEFTRTVPDFPQGFTAGPAAGIVQNALLDGWNQMAFSGNSPDFDADGWRGCLQYDRLNPTGGAGTTTGWGATTGHGNSTGGTVNASTTAGGGFNFSSTGFPNSTTGGWNGSTANSTATTTGGIITTGRPSVTLPPAAECTTVAPELNCTSSVFTVAVDEHVARLTAVRAPVVLALGVDLAELQLHRLDEETQEWLLLAAVEVSLESASSEYPELPNAALATVELPEALELDLGDHVFALVTDSRRSGVLAGRPGSGANWTTTTGAAAWSSSTTASTAATTTTTGGDGVMTTTGTTGKASPSPPPPPPWTTGAMSSTSMTMTTTGGRQQRSEVHVLPGPCFTGSSVGATPVTGRELQMDDVLFRGCVLYFDDANPDPSSAPSSGDDNPIDSLLPFFVVAATVGGMLVFCCAAFAIGGALAASRGSRSRLARARAAGGRATPPSAATAAGGGGGGGTAAATGGGSATSHGGAIEMTSTASPRGGSRAGKGEPRRARPRERKKRRRRGGQTNSSRTSSSRSRRGGGGGRGGGATAAAVSSSSRRHADNDSDSDASSSDSDSDDDDAAVAAGGGKGEAASFLRGRATCPQCGAVLVFSVPEGGSATSVECGACHRVSAFAVGARASPVVRHDLPLPATLGDDEVSSQSSSG